MGSIVYIAIKHGQPQKYDHDIADLINEEMHKTDRVPKFFSSKPILDIKDHYFATSKLRDRGILVSNYHDLEYPSTLLISHDFLVSLNIQSVSLDKVESEKDLIKEIEKLAKNGRYPFSSKKYSFEKPEPVRAQVADSQFSVFSIYTDTMSESTSDEHIANILNFCQSGICVNRTIGRPEFSSGNGAIRWYGGAVNYLGTFNGNSMAIVNSNHGDHKIIRMPYRKIDFDFNPSLAKEDRIDRLNKIEWYSFQKILSSIGVNPTKRSKDAEFRL